MSTPTDETVLRLECGCGFVVEATEHEVVQAGRRHGRESHGIELSVDYVRTLARPRQARPAQAEMSRAHDAPGG